MTVHDQIHLAVKKLSEIEKLLAEVKKHFTQICIKHYEEKDGSIPKDRNGKGKA